MAIQWVMNMMRDGNKKRDSNLGAAEVVSVITRAVESNNILIPRQNDVFVKSRSAIVVVAHYIKVRYGKYKVPLYREKRDYHKVVIATSK
jgi:hypothetical protein